MFPKLDGDLSLVAQHFRFDHLTVSDDTTSTTIATTSRTIAAHAKDDEDDESTLSADCHSSVDFARRTDDVIVSKATKILEQVINKAEIPKRRSETSLIDSVRNASAARGVRKQISLHESGSTMSLTTISHSHQRSDVERYPRRNVELSRFLSIDHRSISDTEDNAAGGSAPFAQRADTKTQSCANLKLSPHSPGAVLVKEKYIELPKRFARRSLTPSSTSDNMQLAYDRRVLPASASMGSTSAMRPRFVTTKVDESRLSDSNQ